MYLFAHDPHPSRGGYRARRIHYATIQISMCPLDDLKVVGLVLGSHEVMSDEEIDQDQSTIWLELAIVQCLNDLGKGSELLIVHIDQKNPI
jgi:hypothetical protein